MFLEITEETISNAKKVNDCPINILPYHKIFYYSSILYTAECSINAFNYYDYLLKEENVSPTQLVSAVQEAIGHAGVLAFYFWNMGSARQAKEIKNYIKFRGKELREEFKLNDESPLKNRSLRNMFEHFDEKLDIFLLNTVSGNFFPQAVIGSHYSIEESQNTSKFFKLLDKEEKCLVLLNRKYFFDEIHTEVKNIYKVALQKVRENG